MGRTVSPCTSFRMTIGALVDGSTISPRIFISISMQRPLCYGFAHQAVGETLCDPHRQVASRSGKDRLRGGKVQCFVLRSAAYDLSAGLIMAFNHYFQNFAYVIAVIGSLDFALAIEQDLQTLRLELVRNGVGHCDGRRVGTRRILESEDGIVLDFVQKGDGLLEVGWGLTGEAYDNVGGHADPAFCRLDP